VQKCLMIEKGSYCAKKREMISGESLRHERTELRIQECFPHVPGFFIVTAIYMLSEKVSGANLADSTKQQASHQIRAKGEGNEINKANTVGIPGTRGASRRRGSCGAWPTGYSRTA
jgi:hypothetical protein